MKSKIVVTSIIISLLFGGGFLINHFNQNNEQIIEVKATSHPNNYDSYTYNGTYYSNISGTGDNLRKQLTSLIYPKGWYTYGGSGSDHLSSILQKADEDPDNANNMIYLYTRDSVKKNAASSWNREHVWPRANSNNCWGTGSGAGSDILHIRPTYNDTNNRRGNLKYGDATNGTSLTYNGITYGKATDSYFEPLDSVKGDVARICMYVYVAYYNHYNNLPPLTNTFSNFDTLLTWHINDRPDVLEGNRNDYSQTSKQANRNPFVDCPEYAWQIFGSKCSSSVLEAAKAAYPDDGSEPVDPVTPDPTPTPTEIEEINVNDAIDIAKALDDKQISDAQYKVNGIIVSDVEKSTKYENTYRFYIADSEDGEQQLYAWWPSCDTTPEKGDKVQILGKLENYGGTPEIVEGVVTILNDSGDDPVDPVNPDPTPVVGELKEITIDSMPTKLEYDGGEKFDSTGLKVSAVYSNNTKKDVTNKINLTTPNMNKKGRVTITISYNEGNVTVNKSFFITITSDAPSGCGGSVIASSFIISLTSLLGGSLLLFKRKKD